MIEKNKKTYEELTGKHGVAKSKRGVSETGEKFIQVMKDILKGKGRIKFTNKAVDQKLEQP